jgi:hypothetical protein
MLRWMADHAQSPRVMRHVERMLEVPRTVGSGCQVELSLTEPFPNIISMGVE